VTPYPAHTLLSFTTSSSTGSSSAISPAPLQKGHSYATDITVNTDVNTITGVQIEASYDPNVLTNVRITPGPFFTNPNVINPNPINKTDGKISYIIAIQPEGRPVQGQGVVATIHYTVSPTATATATTLSFLPKSYVS